jgi:hypothetical protein
MTVALARLEMAEVGWFWAVQLAEILSEHVAVVAPTSVSCREYWAVAFQGVLTCC